MPTVTYIGVVTDHALVISSQSNFYTFLAQNCMRLEPGPFTIWNQPSI